MTTTAHDGAGVSFLSAVHHSAVVASLSGELHLCTAAAVETALQPADRLHTALVVAVTPSSGLLRGRPGLGGLTAMASSRGSRYGLSPAWPRVIRMDGGRPRPRPSTARKECVPSPSGRYGRQSSPARMTFWGSEARP
jgi:hypothetical protein